VKDILRDAAGSAGMVDLTTPGTLRANLTGAPQRRALDLGIWQDGEGWMVIPPVLIGQVLRKRWVDAARAMGMPVDRWISWSKRDKERELPGVSPASREEIRDRCPGLRGYQVDGVEVLGANGLMFMLNDEMGLGKTVSTWSSLEVFKEPFDLKRVLVIGTKSVVRNWPREAERWAPSWDVRPANTPSKLQKLLTSGFEGAIVISWGQLSKKLRHGHRWPEIIELLVRWAPDVLVADEAHYAKEWTSSRGQVFLELTYAADRVLPMTGTPMRNRPKELWMLMQAVRPALYPAFGPFGQRYCGPTVTYLGKKRKINYKGATNKEELAARLDEVQIRRRKRGPNGVLADLPDVINHTRHYDAPVALRRSWKVVLEMMRANRGEEPSAELMALFTAAYRETGEAKVPHALSLLDEIWESRGGVEPTIILLHHSSVVEALEAAIAKRGLRQAKIVGSVSDSARQQIVDRFQAGEIDVFIGSQACKEGVTLTRSNIVVRLERWWTHADEDQGSSRADRFGQTRGVEVFCPHMPGTMDDYHAKLVDKKKNLALDIVDARGLLKAMMTELK
jgi:SWI/SNF-related matrix-associated actin-dependent regulator 1 of chromatin subfamily A